MNGDIDIYLLTSNDEMFNIPAILIWSENETAARSHAYTQYAKATQPGQQIPVLKNNPYECNTSVSCKKLLLDEDIQLLKSSEHYQEIKYNNTNYLLMVDHPVKVI